MIVNKSMFPLQTGFGVISKMQDRFAVLQMQLGTGNKASTLSDMGRDLPLSLSVRSRLAKIEGFSANIDTVALRLSFLDNTLSRFGKMESEARNSAVPGQYGTNNINMATLPGISMGRFDELVTLLNAEVAGRYLFGGSNTDKAPLPTTSVLLDGQGGRAGFKTVLGERLAADVGTEGLGRVFTSIGADPDGNKVTLTEDGIHPFGLKLSNVTSTAGMAAVQWQDKAPSTVAATPPNGNEVSVRFSTDPAQQMQPGETITLGITLPDGVETQIVITAIAEKDTPAGLGQFELSNDATINATRFEAALTARLKSMVGGELEAASSFAAAQNFFNGPGEPMLRVDGDPATATQLRVTTAAETVQWYSGQSPAISADNRGRLDVSTDTDTVTLSRHAPESAAHGFRIVDFETAAPGINIVPPTLPDSAFGVEFTAVPAPGDKVEITLAEPPNGVERSVTLTAVNGKPGPGQFRIGGTSTETADNFADALKDALTVTAMAAEGNPRQSVTAQVDDTTRVNYGMQANEAGFLALMRTLASMSVATYSTTSKPEEAQANRDRFDAMAARQQEAMSAAHDSERGSIEILTMELGIAHGALNHATQRHIDYKAQLDNLLSDIETVSKEDVAMEILALQTRLQASYQATSMISKLSLVNFI